jgi:hypothetical protein
LVRAHSVSASSVASDLAAELAELELRLPRGRLTPQELGEIAKYRDTAQFIGEVSAAGSGFVSLGLENSWLLPPTGRNIHVLSTPDPISALIPYRPLLTTCAFAGAPTRRETLTRTFPGARVCDFGYMQRPPFDGPVDRRDI